MSNRRIHVTLKVMAWTTAVFICALSLGIFVVLMNPEMVINKNSAKKILKFISSDEMQITSEISDVGIESQSLFVKDISIRLEDSTIASKDIKFKTQQTNVNFQFDLLNWPYFVTEIGPMQLKNSTIRIQTHEEQDNRETQPINWNKYKKLLGKIKVKPLSVKNFTVEIVDEEKNLKSFKADVDLKLSSDRAATFIATIQGVKNIPIKTLTTQFSVDLSLDENIPGIDVQINGDFGKQGRINGTASIEKLKSDKSIFQSIKANLFYRLNKVKIEAKLLGEISKSGKIQLNPEIKVFNIADSLNKVAVSKCQINGGFFDDDFEKGKLDLTSCLLSLERNNFEDEEEFFAIPQKVAFELKGNYQFDFLDGFDSVVVDIQAGLVPLKSDFYEITGGTGVKLAGKWSDFENAKLGVDVDTHMNINRFSNVVTSFSKTAFAVPAPFNTLEGKIGCDFKGKMQLNEKTAFVPIICNTNLKGSKQSMVIASNGIFRLLMHKEGLQPDLEMTIVLQDVGLQLPDIKIAQGVPALKSDKRIVDEIDFDKDSRDQAQGKKQTLPLNYNIVIKNGTKPVKIYSPDISGFIPLAVDLNLVSSKGVIGKIVVQTFEVKIINKVTKIDHIKLQFKPDEPIGIDALVIVPRTDYDVLVSVYGSSADPKYKIYSDPPRADSEVMASLMYGQSDGLNSDKQRSVSETQAAMADGAIGLISMFYLASTPIQSVGYNPHSGVFSAAVEVKEGVSLSIGTNQEGRNQLGLSKRLGGNWSIETFAVKNRESDTNKGVAMLRWAKRY